MYSNYLSQCKLQISVYTYLSQFITNNPYAYLITPHTYVITPINN